MDRDGGEAKDVLDGLLYRSIRQHTERLALDIERTSGEACLDPKLYHSCTYP